MKGLLPAMHWRDCSNCERGCAGGNDVVDGDDGGVGFARHEAVKGSLAMMDRWSA